jgi:hypothetical protein
MVDKVPSRGRVVVYHSGELELDIPLEQETVWVTQKQLALLFEVETHTVNYHIKNIFKQKELDKTSTVRKIRIVQKEGLREVTRDVEHYQLNMIISVGYRVNSLKATRFRQWATSVLKQYIHSGYAINTAKITADRFVSLEHDVAALKSGMNEVTQLIQSNQLTVKQGVFYNGEIFDAYAFVSDVLGHARREVVIIDNYIDVTVLVLLSKYPTLQFTIVTKNISKQLRLDIDKYNKQYNNLTIKTSGKYHDRFLLIDDAEAYHIGASLKDLGKKVFAFSKIDIDLIQRKKI